MLRARPVPAAGTSPNRTSCATSSCGPSWTSRSGSVARSRCTTAHPPQTVSSLKEIRCLCPWADSATEPCAQAAAPQGFVTLALLLGFPKLGKMKCPPPPHSCLGSSRMVSSEIEAPNLSADLVWSALGPTRPRSPCPHRLRHPAASPTPRASARLLVGFSRTVGSGIEAPNLFSPRSLHAPENYCSTCT